MAAALAVLVVVIVGFIKLHILWSDMPGNDTAQKRLDNYNAKLRQCGAVPAIAINPPLFAHGSNYIGGNDPRYSEVKTQALTPGVKADVQCPGHVQTGIF